MFLKHYDEWCLFSYTYIKNIIEAEEVVQDVCVSILLRKHNPKILNLKAYIITAIKNKSLKKLKELQKTVSINTIAVHTLLSSEDDMILKEDKLRLQKAIESLPYSSKKAFKLCVLEKQKYQTVADIMGISANTVKYHIKRAYKILRAEMNVKG